MGVPESGERNWEVPRAEAGRTLQDFLRGHLGVSNRQAKALVDAREVYVNGKRVWMARHVLHAGDRVRAPGAARVAPREAVEPTILFQDDWLVAVDKPPGCVTDQHPASLEARLRIALALPELRALHRLDRDTSGVLLFTRLASERDPYVELFRRHELRKGYQAIVRGVPPRDSFRIDARLDGKEALTEVRVLRRAAGHCRLACVIPTGRTHQIRRHLEMAGCVIVGDKLYGGSAAPPEVERGIARQMLHAAELEFRCPHSARLLALHAPLPEDFRDALRALRLG